jgi:hypothetical protein
MNHSLHKGKPHIDYSKSYILTSEEYVASFEAKACRKQALQKEAQLKKLVAKESKQNCRLEKLEKAAKSKARAEERAPNKRYSDYWEKVKRDGWGDKLHELIKTNMRNPPLNLRTPQNLAVPSVTRKLQCCELDSKEKGKTPVW